MNEQRREPRDPLLTRARTDLTSPREPRPLGEGLTALDDDLAGTMASEGGRSAQEVEAPLSAADHPNLPTRHRSLYAAAALVALAGALVLFAGLRHREA
jgi:hypothetical protein